MERPLGTVVLFGSGEISSHAQPVYARIMARLEPPVQVGILETPAGFQLNSANVAEEIAVYLHHHLQNFHPQTHIIPARKRGTPYSPDNAEILDPLYTSNMLFFGPGSPTYAVAQLKGSLAWEIVQARHRLGAALVAASAATIAMSAYALPVYEIYKVGEDVHWKPGLGFCAAYGLSLTLVPHWNNNDGGDKHDTSRCFMGKPRFAELLALLPAETVVVGIDELTALIIEPEEGRCRVMGMGGVTVLAATTRRETRFESGSTFAMSELGPCHSPNAREGISDSVWTRSLAAEEARQRAPEPPDEVVRLAQERAAARAQCDWAASDSLRERIEALGWQVRDKSEGWELVPASDN